MSHYSSYHLCAEHLSQHCEEICEEIRTHSDPSNHSAFELKVKREKKDDCTLCLLTEENL